jgi:BASS family bile acid:Na+ symporter
MLATTLFPIGAVLITLLSYFFPALLTPFDNTIVPLLGIIMFGMGMTLRPENFLEVCARPKLILIGVSLQFVLMPMIAFVVGTLLELPKALLVGLVLVGACPGGTASNVICYLARGDVALSITLTTVSTILAVLLTPFLVWLYIGEIVPVPVVDMMLNIFLIIIIPVASGVLINNYFSAYVHLLKHVFPYVSVFAIIFIIGIIVAMNQPQIPLVALPLLTAVFWHNILGLLCGYFLARFFNLEERVCRTMAIEVGMQNSGLGVALAGTYFANMTLATLPGAIFSIWHNITGSILAGYWSRKTKETDAAGY